MKTNEQPLIIIIMVYLLALFSILFIWGYTPTNDGDGYIELAKICIAHKQIYPCLSLIVGQPFIWNIGAINLVLLSLSLFGSLYPLLVLMCLLKALTACLVGKVAQKLFNNKVAIVTILLYVFYPNNWGQSTTILSEIPMISFVLLAFYWAITRQGMGWLFIAGMVMGLANWFRPIALIFLGTLLLYYLFFERKHRWRKVISLSSGFMFFVFAVGLSCYERTGYFIYQAETFWFNMAEATYEPSVAPQYDTDPYPKGTIRYIEGRDTLTAIQCSDIWKERSMVWLQTHPLEYLKKVPGRLLYMYYNDMDNLPAFFRDKQNTKNRYVLLPYRNLFCELPYLTSIQYLALINWVYYLLLLLLAFVGSISLIRRKKLREAFMPLMVVVGGSIALVLAIHGETRFKDPFIPFIFMLAAVGCVSFNKMQFLEKENSKHC